MEQPFLSLNSYLRGLFGCRVQKIPLDAGLSCPNRDGTKGTGGCIYCSASGSGTGALARGISVREQMALGIAWARRRYKARRFIAYFQSFSNTYGNVQHLGAIYRESLVSPDVVGLFIGTRPDCVHDAVLDTISEAADGRLVWMELGLQSASDATLHAINRGHTRDDFVRAVEMTKARGLPVCAHVIFGLPGEGKEEMLATIALLKELGVEGVKFHQLYALGGTELARLFRLGQWAPLDMDTYARLVAEAIAMLGPGVVVHRLSGDPPQTGLLAPDWSRDKSAVRERIINHLRLGSHESTAANRDRL